MAGRSVDGVFASVRLKRVYDPREPADGVRVLVDRLWPRGVRRDGDAVDRWLKDLAPSDALRRRVHGDPDGWDAFVADYAAELADGEGARRAVADLAGLAAAGPVTLVYAAKNTERNNAVALLAWLRSPAR